LIGELKARFGTTHVEDLGDCIVIPGDELDLDWLLELFELGHRFEGTFLDSHPVIIVKLDIIASPSANDAPQKREVFA
jgi:hypothetical protein